MEPVCDIDRLVPGRGAAALLADGTQVAVFRLADDRLFAVANADPATGAHVISRGLVGDRAGEPTVASPLHKQVYSLTSGRCLDDPAAALEVFDVALVQGRVHVSAAVPAAAAA